MANGAFTTDHVTAQQLYTEFTESVAVQNEQGVPFRTQLCKETTQKTVRVRQRSMTAQKLGADTTVPDRQHMEYREFSLSEPVRYGVATAMTRESFDRGVSSDEMREEHAEALRAMSRYATETIISASMTDGGWWDATMTAAPPPYKMNTFATSHDHYLAYNVAGVPALSHFIDLKRTIQEHGYGRVVAFMHGDNSALIEKKAEWAAATDLSAGGVLADLQKLGVTPAFMAAGVPVAVEDWIPENYLLAFCLDEKPLRWRHPEGTENSDIYTVDSVPDGQYRFITEYYSYRSAKVVHRGAGAAAYLSSATWTDPTFAI